MKVKRSFDPARLTGGIFFGIGALILVVGLVMLGNNIAFRRTAVKTEAEIVSIRKYRSSGETHHEVTVAYTANGKTYMEELNYYSAGMREGKTIAVYYDPNRPQSIRSGVPIGETIFIALGDCFALAGGIVLSAVLKKALRKKRLIRDGEQLTGTVISVVEQTNVTVNGRHPLKAEVEVIDPLGGDRYLYSSYGVMSDISWCIGMTMTVYADRNDRSVYYVDIEGLTENYDGEGKAYDYR